jgi:hypothetical protein
MLALTLLPGRYSPDTLSANANGRISNVASGLCLDVKGQATAAANQVWTGR